MYIDLNDSFEYGFSFIQILFVRGEANRILAKIMSNTRILNMFFALILIENKLIYEIFIEYDLIFFCALLTLCVFVQTLHFAL